MNRRLRRTSNAGAAGCFKKERDSVQIADIIRSLAALVAGGIIGAAFGAVQNLALRRNEKLQQTGELRSSWSAMPGSMRRAAYLLVALVLVQILCPLLFVDGSQWYVSAGVAVGYGAVLYRELRRRQSRKL